MLPPTDPRNEASEALLRWCCGEAADNAFRHAGRDSLSPGCNPYPAGSGEALQWQQGLDSVIDDANRYVEERRQREINHPAWPDRPDFDMNLRGRAR